MKIKITEAERIELENILTLIKSRTPETFKLGIDLLKTYKKFKNTVFLYDYRLEGSGTRRRRIKRTINCNKDFNTRTLVYIYDLSNIDLENNNLDLDYDLDILRFYIEAVLEGDNSFYKG